jgi:hypothetical protein
VSGVSQDDETPTLAQVVGWNAKRLRGDVSGDRLASAAKENGLNWGTGRIADLEAGRVSPTLSTLVALALALGEVRGEPIQLYELVDWDGFVSVSGDLVLSGEALAGYISGNPVQVLVRDYPGGLEEIKEVIDRVNATFTAARTSINPLFADLDTGLCVKVDRRSGEAERRAADALGVDMYALTLGSVYLWGKSLSDERDARAGVEATAQKRGRITRQLMDELKGVLHGDR